jgi:peptidoglycan/LPS O-acetylase OafA/YrhL
MSPISERASTVAEPGAAGFEAGPGPVRFPCFDAFRFFGMVMVLVIHTEFATQVTGPLRPYLARMDVGVPIFFVISGFLLYRPFIARQLAGKPAMKTGTFLRRRVLRVIPGYWFALTVCVLFLGVQMNGIADVFWYYSLLFPFDPSRALGGAGVLAGQVGIPQAWSLTAEFCFYLMLPVLTIGLRRFTMTKPAANQARAALLVALALVAFGQLFRLYFVLADPSWQREAVIWAPNWVDFFALGMTAAVISAWVAAGGRLPRVLATLGRHPWWSWGVAAIAGFAVTRFQPPAIPGVFTLEYCARFALYGVVAVFLLIPVMFGDQTRTRARRVLASRPLVFLGTVSLGFYLFHLAFLHLAEDWTDAPPFGGSFVKIFVITFVCSIAAAIVSYFVVEKPFLRLKDRSIRSLWRRQAVDA